MAIGNRGITVRLAKQGDAPLLATLRYEFRRTIGEPVEDEAAFIRRCREWMASRLASDRWRCWVAETGGEVMGHVWLQAIEKIPNPLAEGESLAYITNVYVRPAYRGEGVGTQLLEAALEWCRHEHVDRAILWPTPRSRALYARHGFAVRDDVMEAILHAEPASQDEGQGRR